jgi:hypothetical protein
VNQLTQSATDGAVNCQRAAIAAQAAYAARILSFGTVIMAASEGLPSFQTSRKSLFPNVLQTGG